MKTRFLTAFGLFVISAILFTSCNSNDAVKEANAANKQMPDSVSTGKVNTSDAEFATAAANGGMMEVELAKLCVEKAQNIQVKDYGAMIVEDHTKANNELKTIAYNKNLMLPEAISTSDQKMIDDLKMKTGKDFDKAYMDMMINDHEQDIKDFKKEADNGKDAVISSYATKILPVLQRHLDAAKTIRKAV